MNDEELTALLSSIRPGQTWRMHYNPGNRNNRLYHVRAVVDNQIVTRYWYGFRWRYVLKDIYFFAVGVESGHLVEETK